MSDPLLNDDDYKREARMHGWERLTQELLDADTSFVGAVIRNAFNHVWDELHEMTEVVCFVNAFTDEVAHQPSWQALCEAYGMIPIPRRKVHDVPSHLPWVVRATLLDLRRDAFDNGMVGDQRICWSCPTSKPGGVVVFIRASSMKLHEWVFSHLPAEMLDAASGTRWRKRDTGLSITIFEV